MGNNSLAFSEDQDIETIQNYKSSQSGSNLFEVSILADKILMI